MVRKKMLVLLAGSPGTGKSYLLNLLKTRFPDLFALTPDEIKECYAESLGFDSLAEKAQIEKQYVKRPPKVRPKNLTFGGRYLYGKISF